MIRDRVPSLQNLAVAVRLLRFLTCNNQTKRVSKKQIVDLWKDIRKLFKTRAAPSLRCLQEALAKNAKKPTDDWIGSFRKLARSKDRFDAPEVGAIAGAFDAEMDNARQVIAQLPPRFRKALGSDLDFRKQPWAVRARLKSGIKLKSVSATVQREIEMAGGLEHFVRKCNRWWEIKSLLKCSDWVIEWPDAAGLRRRIQNEAKACEKRGDLDFSATLEEVKTEVLEILEEARPDWLPSDGSRIKDRHLKLLKAGVLQLPSQLTPLGLRQAVPFAFAPLEIPGQLIEEAIEELFEEDKIQSTTVAYIPSGSNTAVEQEIYYVGSGTAGGGPSSAASAEPGTESLANVRQPPGKQRVMTPGERFVWEALDGQLRTVNQISILSAESLERRIREETIRQHISRLRKRGHSIECIRRQGYYRPDNPGEEATKILKSVHPPQ